MPTNSTQEQWLSSAPGQWINPDNAFGYQCVDVADDYAQAIFPGVPFSASIGGVGGAREILDAAADKYFTRIDNNLNDPNLLPERGDIVVFDGTPANVWGHVAIVLSATAQNVTVVQQDGGLQTAAAVATLPYWGPGTGYIKGWLRPKLGLTPSPAPVVSAPVSAPSGTVLRGVDISMHQKGINVPALGAQFAGIKATEGIGYTDSAYASNLASARGAGIPVMHYHMGRPGPENDPVLEARWFLSVVVPNFVAGDKLALDWEMDDVSRTGWAKVFLDTANGDTGHAPLIYMNGSTANAYNWSAVQSAGYRLWLAYYGVPSAQGWGARQAAPATPGWDVAMYQYTDSGQLPGYSGSLDLNEAYGDWGASAAITVAPAAAAPSRGAGQWVVVEQNDTLSSIVAQWGSSVAAIVAANSLEDANKIYPTQQLFIPGGSTSAPAPAAPVSAPAVAGQCTVVSGDTVSGIAIQVGVSLAAMKAVNPGIDYEHIDVGQVLNLPSGANLAALSGAPAAPKPVAAISQCIVADGDTLSGIADQFGTTVARLIAANPQLQDPNSIFPGQVLNL